MDVETIPNLLEQQRDAAPEELQHFFLTFADCWERKLWHELTDAVMLYFEEEESEPQRIQLYDTFIKTFADKINKLKLVTLGLLAADQCRGEHSQAIHLWGTSTNNR
jgi:26S proteasome regulatory subunit N9